jgi:hypothetical protein
MEAKSKIKSKAVEETWWQTGQLGGYVQKCGEKCMAPHGNDEALGQWM